MNQSDIVDNGAHIRLRERTNIGGNGKTDRNARICFNPTKYNILGQDSWPGFPPTYFCILYTDKSLEQQD